MWSFLIITPLFFSIHWCQPIEYSSITCVDVQGSNSGSYDDAKSTISCASAGYPGYTMTSCGIVSSWPNIDGSYIDSNHNCIAQQGDDSGGYVKASARCCLLDSSVNCIARNGPRSGTGDDATSTIQCQSNEYITGCTIFSPWKAIDGAKPDVSQQRCVAWHSGDGEGADSNARCCSYPSNPRYTLELECYNSQGPLSGSNDDAKSIITCDTANNYFVAGCSGHRNVPNVEAWYTSGNQCIARNKNEGSGVYAQVICCREKKTWIPTESPTVDPTKSPTSQPSFYPTISPTKTPSKMPTMSPTKSPTKYPTINPTVNPSVNPSRMPTKYPTNNPTVTPTDMPSLTPTKRPTKSPERKLNINVPTESPTTNEIEIIVSTNDIQTTDVFEKKQLVSGTGDLLSKYMYYMIASGGLLILVIIAFILCFYIKKRRNKQNIKQITIAANSPISTNGTEMTTVINVQPGEARHIEKVKSLSSVGDIGSNSEDSGNGELFHNGNNNIDGGTIGNTLGNDNELAQDESDSVSDNQLYGGGGTTQGNE